MARNLSLPGKILPSKRANQKKLEIESEEATLKEYNCFNRNRTDSEIVAFRTNLSEANLAKCSELSFYINLRIV